MKPISPLVGLEDTRQERLFAGLIVALAGALFVAWEVVHRGVYAYSTASYPFDDADEWRYTACSRLVEHGYSLFDQVFSAQPPLFFFSLASGMRLFGDSITGARAAELGFGVLALVATAWVAWELAGPIASAVATTVLAVSPAFLIYTHTVEAEVPMMACVTVALAFALGYRRTGRMVLLTLAGLSVAAATLVKLFALEAVLPIAWLIVMMPSTMPASLGATARSRHSASDHKPRALMVKLSVFCAAAVLPVAADLAFISPRRQWEQVVTLHSRAAGLQLPHLLPPQTILRQFLAFDAGLSAFALAGIISVLIAKRSVDAVCLALWCAGTIVMLFLFRPLFPHHAAILSTSLAVSAGVGAAAGVELWRSGRRFAGAPVALAAAVYVVLVPRLIHADRHTLIESSPSNLTVLVAYVRHTIPPTAFVAADNVRVAEQASRLVPPPLCDPSTVRLLAGFLTAQDLISATRHYRARLVIPLGTYSGVPSFMRWVRMHYQKVQVPGGGPVYQLPPTR